MIRSTLQFRGRHVGAAVAAMLLWAAGAALAQPYPDKPVRFVVPYPPGGGTDVIARIVQESFQKALGQQIIIDNRPGAGGTVGTRQVAKSAPDGYTLVLGYTGTLAIGPGEASKSV